MIWRPWSQHTRLSGNGGDEQDWKGERIDLDTSAGALLEWPAYGDGGVIWEKLLA